MKTSESQFLENFFWFFIIVVCVINFLLSGLLRPVLPIDETRYLTVAWEMWNSGNFVVPHLNHLPYSHKPPLLFWLINFFWWLFGVNTFAARIVPEIMGFGVIVLTYVLARLLWQSRFIALFSAFVMTAIFPFMLFSSLIMFDVLLTFWVLLGHIAFIQVWRVQQFRWWWLYGFSLGAALLTKGPVALLHLGVVPLLAPFWLRHTSIQWKKWYLGLMMGIAVGVAIILAWAIPAAYLGGEQYRQEIFVWQTSARIVNSFAHAKPFWFYVVTMPFILFPWLWWPSFWKTCIKKRNELCANTGIVYCCFWFTLTFIIFSCVSGKQIQYLMPAWPAFALLFAYVVHLNRGETRINLEWDTRIVLLPLFIITLLLISVPYVSLLQHNRLLSQITVIPARYFYLWLAFSIIVFWLSKYGRVIHQMFLTALIAWSIFLMQFCYLPIFDYTDLSQFTQKMRRYVINDIAFTQKYRGEFGFLARLRQPVQEIDRNNIESWLHQHPQGIVIAKYKIKPTLHNVVFIEEIPYRDGKVALIVNP